MSESTNEMFLTINQDLDPVMLKHTPGPDDLALVEAGEILLLRVTVYSPEAAMVAGKPGKIELAEVSQDEPTDDELDADPDAEGNWTVDWSPIR